MNEVEILKKVLDYMVNGKITGHDLKGLLEQADRRGSGSRNEYYTCEFVLKGHRGYEGETESLKRMASYELGLKNPDKWDDSDWEKFGHWQNVFHSHDVVSGPNCTEIANEKYRRGLESQRWIEEHCG